MASEQSPTLWIETQGGSRTAYELRPGSQVVGRSPEVAISIAAEWVSQRHAELYWDGHTLSVRDLGSRNGTKVNANPVVDWVGLRDGDVISFANVQAVVDLGGTSPVEDVPTGSHPAAASGSRSGSGQASRRLSEVPIFVSHSSEDKVAARTVAAYLRRVGWTVWIDESGIAGGKDWRGELVRALEETWVVILLVSLSSMRSKWVVREVQVADRLGKRILPVLVDDAPYPDALRMILVGVQQIDLTRLGDQERRNQQLARLDDALILTARQPGETPPGKTQIAVGRTIRAIGFVGIVIGFALFVFLGISEVNQGPSPDEGIPAPFIGWAVFAVFLIIAGIGEGIRRSGLRKGI